LAQAGRLFPQPFAPHHRHEDINDLRIPMAASSALNDLERLFGIKCRAIGTIGGQCLESIGDG
jgi:hypothetical protein